MEEFIMLDKNTLSSIRKLAFQIDWDDAFDGKSKGNQHLFRITEIAKFLANKEGANLFVVEAGALLHDVALPFGDDTNCEKNKEIIAKLLKSFILSDNELDKIIECVAFHEGLVVPKGLEAQVVHDADVLEKSGLLGIIRHTWKLTNLKKIKSTKVDEKVVDVILQHIQWRGQRVQTFLAKKINLYLTAEMDLHQAKRVISKVIELAQNGVITEEIAKALSVELNDVQKEKLKEQLNLMYLHHFA